MIEDFVKIVKHFLLFALDIKIFIKSDYIYFKQYRRL